MDKIELLGMEFYGYHGVLPEEQILGQRFIIDATMYVPLQVAGKTDDLEKTVNYAEVYSLVKQIVDQDPRNLIETVAEVIAKEILKKYPIQEVEIRVAKEHPPIPGILRQVAVTIRRNREDVTK